MENDGLGVVDVLVVIASPFITTILTVVFLLGWWAEAAWGLLRGDQDG